MDDCGRLEKNTFRLADEVEFKIKNEKLRGIVTAIYFNKKIIRVRVIKNGIRCWHEWMKPNQLKLINRKLNNE